MQNELSKSKMFFVLSLSFLLGVFLASYFDFKLIFVYFVLLLALFVCSLNYKRKLSKIILFSMALFVLGFVRTENKIHSFDSIKEYDSISIKSIVSKESERKNKYQEIIAKIRDDRFLQNEKVLIYGSLFEDFRYGDELDLKCKLEAPKNFSDDFDYRMYLAKEGVVYICKNPKITKTGNNLGNPFYKAVLDFKEELEDNINETIPFPEAALATGILLGNDSYLSDKVKDDFSKTGMTHIVAVSGYNVTIIAEYLILAGVFLGLWRKQAFYFAISGIFIFILAIGFPSSAVRAGVMGTLLFWAMKNGRLSNSYSAILFSGGVMVFINPLLLRWDIGFQLSFLATLGIIILSSSFREFTEKFRFFGLTEIILLTVSAQLFVLPIIMYNFHSLSVVSLIANLLILPIVPVSMLLVFMTTMGGLIFTPLSLLFAWLSIVVLKYEIAIVQFMAKLKWSSVEVSEFGVFWMIVYYLILFAIVFYIKNKKECDNVYEF